MAHSSPRDPPVTGALAQSWGQDDPSDPSPHLILCTLMLSSGAIVTLLGGEVDTRLLSYMHCLSYGLYTRL